MRLLVWDGTQEAPAIWAGVCDEEVRAREVVSEFLGSMASVPSAGDQEVNARMVAISTASVSTAPEWCLSGALMRLVAGELTARGFDVHPLEREGERRICIERRGGRCYLSVDDLGLVEWECTPWASSEPDPRRVADIAAFLLAGRADGVPGREGDRKLPGTSFMGIAGRELRARGFDVRLDVFAEDEYFEVWGDLLVKNPSARADATVRITEDGAITWECDYPHEAFEFADSAGCLAIPGNGRKVADSIAAAIAGVVALSSGTGDGGADA